MPLKTGVGERKVSEFVKAFDEADKFISSLVDSSAGIDHASRAVVWEMSFLDEESYTGPCTSQLLREELFC